MTALPPGWPRQVLPAGAPGFEESATAWLFDHCPADYRGQAAWRKYPIALGWVTVRHVDSQLETMRAAYREARVDLADLVSPEALPEVLPEVLAALEAEGVRLRAVARAAELVFDALQGRTYVPRL